ncbi:hypothetical protein A355_0150 [Candidatus Carsonella ruddii HT isolate Thao2000]|uniref:Uncharacterized protein n=1 Tax=Candidatus Carsonella ruddii HT isolate Thao2000 TaxID=1202539 RepID=J3TWC7_CARRU|nr:hypothetical protein [Candidatus Carsonella ruddii]AFP84170.1 hypothetical protein A355_0150 [Candidatus Carsonella ruddii HT isolate Thao2000]
MIFLSKSLLFKKYFITNYFKKKFYYILLNYSFKNFFYKKKIIFRNKFIYIVNFNLKKKYCLYGIF